MSQKSLSTEEEKIDFESLPKDVLERIVHSLARGKKEDLLNFELTHKRINKTVQEIRENITKQLQPKIFEVGKDMKPISSIAFNPDSKTIAIASNYSYFEPENYINILNVHNGEITQRLGPVHFINSIAFSPDGITLASGSDNSEINVWEASTSKFIKKINEHTDVIYIAFSPDNNTLAYILKDKRIILVNLNQDQKRITLQKPRGILDYGVNEIAFSPNGLKLAGASGNNNVRIWNATNGKFINTLEGHTNVVLSVAFSPDGSILASGSQDKTVKFWNIEKGELIRTLEGHTKFVTKVAFRPDGKILASASGDKTIRLWRVSDGEFIGMLQNYNEYVRNIVFSPDNKTLAVLDKTNIYLYNIEPLDIFVRQTGGGKRKNTKSKK